MTGLFMTGDLGDQLITLNRVLPTRPVRSWKRGGPAGWGVGNERCQRRGRRVFFPLLVTTGLARLLLLFRLVPNYVELDPPIHGSSTLGHVRGYWPVWSETLGFYAILGDALPYEVVTDGLGAFV